MILEEWCDLAQEEQFSSPRLGHLYSNYRYCCKYDLIVDKHIEQFQEALAAVTRPTTVRPVSGGYAATCCVLATQAAHTGKTSVPLPSEDFRFTNTPIDLADGELLFSIQRVVALAGTSQGYRQEGSGNSGPNPPLNLRLVWLTPADAAIEQLFSLPVRPKSSAEIIATLADLVGLAVFDRPFRRALRVFKSVAERAFYRPHALSGVIGHRFSAASQHEPFGTTVRSSTGDFGMRECIAREVDLEDVTDSPAGRSLIARLFAVCGLPSPPDSVSCEIPASAVEPVKGYDHFHAIVVSRLEFVTPCEVGACRCVP